MRKHTEKRLNHTHTHAHTHTHTRTHAHTHTHTHTHTRALECKVEQRHNNDDDGTEHEDADLFGRHERTATPEPSVARKLLVLSLRHDALVLHVHH